MTGKWEGPPVPGCLTRILAAIGLIAAFVLGADTALAIGAVRHHQAASHQVLPRIGAA